MCIRDRRIVAGELICPHTQRKAADIRERKTVQPAFGHERAGIGHRHLETVQLAVLHFAPQQNMRQREIRIHGLVVIDLSLIHI